MQPNMDTKPLRSFGLIVGGIFAVIGLWPLLWRSEPLRLWALLVGLGLLFPALVRPRSLKPAYRAWMALGLGLGWINTRLILGGIFYVLITPVGLIRRLLGKDAMHRLLDPGAETYRVGCQARPRSHMTHQF